MSEIHPWAASPAALRAVKRAVAVPVNRLGSAALRVGRDELESQALVILMECAQAPLREGLPDCVQCGGSLASVRKGARFCGERCRDLHKKHRQRGRCDAQPVTPSKPGYWGKMHEWAPDRMLDYAVKEIGDALCNYVRTYNHGATVVSLPDNRDFVAETDPSPAEALADYLSHFRGVTLAGDETFEELAEAAVNLGIVAKESL